MKQALELHDTTIREVKLIENKAILILDKAIIHRSNGVPGVDSGTCWTQLIEIVIEDVTAKHMTENLPNEINGGYFFINDRKYANMIELPINQRGKIEFFAETMFGEKLYLKGNHIKSNKQSEMVFLEYYEGNCS